MKKHLIADKPKRIIRRIFKITAWILIAAFAFAVICNIGMVIYSDKYVVSVENADEITDIDCIIILGAAVREDGSLSTVLEERVSIGAELYKNGVAQKILVSGDHSKVDYNEVGAMKEYMVEMGISADVIFTDHAGFDTYDTMYRARDVFQAKKVIIVTQEFHISRAVFIARSLGLDAYGVRSDEGHRYFNLITEARECVARTKYVFDAIFKPEPTYLGEAIPIWGEASASDG